MSIPINAADTERLAYAPKDQHVPFACTRGQGLEAVLYP